MTEWQSIPLEQESAWFAIIDQIFYGASVDLPACPNCSAPHLRFFYLRTGGISEDGGGFWIWCHSCHRYEHLSCKVPDWWHNIPGIPTKALSAIPDWLDDNWINIVLPGMKVER